MRVRGAALALRSGTGLRALAVARAGALAAP